MADKKNNDDYTVCPACSGTGKNQDNTPCFECNGTGKRQSACTVPVGAENNGVCD
ncbi:MULTISPECIES: hypothetical protein [Desulfovibrio]|uniref:Chaperone protein n=3 Tax=Desulfovibrio TaxID=872 RepID=A0AA94HTR2_DESDE|nr:MULTISPECIES: hypothetical protein [Desulfovibrio]ATD81272.1 chaperone protein [Desulfovibrio sp. G11]MDY0204323.1 chaperone protein [Desulfovibrio desulfuricans]SFW58327.1 hypothetical protein SAMN02910291_01954 [Desulfovibrio desulfuricans]SPD36904.1 Heat shock protein DnaJ [Desulfovibrio sp. G11]